MAERYTRRINLYINGKEVQNDIVSIRQAMRKLQNEQARMTIGSKEYNAHAAKIRSLRGIIQQHNNDLRQTATGWFNLRSAADKFNNYFGMITAAVAAFAGIVTGMKKMKKTIDDFEESMTNVYTLLDDADYDKFKNFLDEGSINLLKKYGFEITDINKSLFDTISAGVPAGESINFMEEAAILAKGGVTSLSTSVDGMTSVMNAYGLAIDENNKVSSAFFTAQKYGKTTVAELASTIGTTVPIAASAGVSYQELLSSVAALTTQGISTDMAMTSMKNAIQSVLKPTKQAEEVLRKFGVPVGRTEVRAKGLGFVLEKLNQVMEKNPDAISKAIPNIRGLTAVSALSGKGLEQYHKILEKVNLDFGQGSSLSKAYDKQMNTHVAKQQARIGQLKAVIIEMADELRPLFTQFIKLSMLSARALLQVVQMLVKHKDGIKALAAGLTAYIIVRQLAVKWDRIHHGLMIAQTTFSKGYALVTGLITGKIKLAAIAQQMWNTAQKANPIGFIAGILAGAVTALVVYVRNLDKVSEAQKAINDVEAEAQKNIVKRKLTAEELLGIARNEKLSLEHRRQALEELNRISPEYFGNLKLETLNAENAKTAMEGYTEALMKQARVEASREKLVELEKERIDTLNEGSDAQLKWHQTLWNGVKSFGNLTAFSMHQAVSSTENAAQAEKQYMEKKNALLGIIGEEINLNKELSELQSEDKDTGSGLTASSGSGSDLKIEELKKAHQQRLNEIKKQYYEETLTKEEYEAKMLTSELAFLELKRQILATHGEDITTLDSEIWDKRIQLAQTKKEILSAMEKEIDDGIKEEMKAENEKLTADIDQSIEQGQKAVEQMKNLQAEEKSILEKRANAYMDLAQKIGDSFDEMLLNQEVSFGQFLRNTLALALDALEKMVIMSIIEATVKGIVATGLLDPTAMARALAKVVAIKAAFGIAKAAVMGGKKKEYYEGGYTGEGGKYEPAGIVHKKEYVIPEEGTSNPLLRPVIDIMELSRRSGTLARLNLDQILQALPQKGYASGGFTTTPSTLPVVNSTIEKNESKNPEFKELIQENIKAVRLLMQWKPKLFIEQVQKELDNWNETQKRRNL